MYQERLLSRLQHANSDPYSIHCLEIKLINPSSGRFIIKHRRMMITPWHYFMWPLFCRWLIRFTMYGTHKTFAWSRAREIFFSLAEDWVPSGPMWRYSFLYVVYRVNLSSLLFFLKKGYFKYFFPSKIIWATWKILVFLFLKEFVEDFHLRFMITVFHF